MVRRTRDIQKKIWLTPQEERTIAKKMEMIGTENFGAYARKMLIDGYIIVVDYTEQKKLAAEINKIGVNINTVCRRINSTGRFYRDDIDELKEKMDTVWQLLKSRLIHNGYGLHSTRGVLLRTPLIFGIYILHNAVSVSDAKVCAHISNHKPRVATDEDCPHLTELFILEDFDFVIHDWLPFRHQMCHFDF